MTEYHTPGPWRFYAGTDDDCNPKPCDIQTFQASGYYANPFLRGPNGETVVGCDEYMVFGSKADAILLAAAPDMLAALQVASVSCGFNKMNTAAQKLVLAAISKATGATHD